MSRGGFAFIVGALVAGIAAGGCGSDDETSTISKAEFVKKVNAICKESVTKVSSDAAAAFRKPDKGAGSDPIGELVDASVVPTLKREVAEIRDFGAPSGDEERVAEILEAVESVIGELESNSEGFNGDSEAYAAAEKPADSYGLSSCPLG